jgi:hypothetical protein
MECASPEFFVSNVTPFSLFSQSQRGRTLQTDKGGFNQDIDPEAFQAL